MSKMPFNMKIMCGKLRASMNDGMKGLKMYIGWMEKCWSNVISICIIVVYYSFIDMHVI